MTNNYGSSASHGVDNGRLRPELPLILCGKCGQKIVMEYRVSKAGPNKGRIFYKCPDRNVSYFIAFDDFFSGCLILLSDFDYSS